MVEAGLAVVVTGALWAGVGVGVEGGFGGSGVGSGEAPGTALVESVAPGGVAAVDETGTVFVEYTEEGGVDADDGAREGVLVCVTALERLPACCASAATCCGVSAIGATLEMAATASDISEEMGLG